MSHRRLLFIVFLVSGVFILSNCTKIKGTDIGLGLIPTADNVSTFDTTIDVIVNNYLTPDSSLPLINADINGDRGKYILGYISNDQRFGKTAASIFLEYKPDSYPFAFENSSDSLYLDSVVVALSWKGTYGDTNAIQSVSVYRMTEKLKADSAYYTNKQVDYGDLLGSKSFAPNILNDSLHLYGQNINNQLRIRLNDQFGRNLLDIDTLGNTPFKSDSLYRAFFNGFAFVPQTSGAGSNGNALMSFAVNDTSTYLRVYYRYSMNGQIDTSFKTFKMNNGILGAATNYIKRDYTGSELSQHTSVKPQGDSLIYIQAAPGTYAQLKIPALDVFKAKKGNVMVHLAEIKLEEAITPGHSNVLTAPNYLYLDILDTTASKHIPFLNDAFANYSYNPLLAGGINKIISDSQNKLVSEYRMNITRHVQSIITKNSPNFPLRLAAPYKKTYVDYQITFALNDLAGGGVVLGGTNHSSKKVKLRIVYTKL